MKKPNFIISGFPKCGTTSLHHYLNEHPQIFMPSQKELHFFTFKILSKLKSGPKDKIVKETQIDSSEKYLNDPKIIIVLRDPINRAYSNYLHLKREQRETLSFNEAIDAEEERIKNKYSDFWYYKFNSTYFEKVVKAKEVFSDVLILTIEQLNKNPEKTIKQVCQFLKVDDSFKIEQISRKFNLGGNYKINLITKILFQPSWFKNRIKRVIKPTPFIKIILMKLSSFFISKPETIDDETLTHLTKYFKEDVAKLKNISVDTSNWREY